MGEEDWVAGERARLVAAMDSYLEALTARDPSRLRLAPNLKATDDTQAIPPGSGLWRTIRGRTPGGHYFVDVERGQVEHWGVIDENGRPAMLAARIKAGGRTIEEIETIVTRPGAFFNPDALLEDASETFHRVLRPEERSSRAELERAVHIYFDAIERGDGSIIPVEGDCRRLVNGVTDSLDDPGRVPAGEEHRALPVARQITEGHYGYIEALRDRRFPIMDVARGLVVCHVIFDHPGDLPRPGGDLPIASPNSMLFTEIFKVVGGKIEEIWALGTNALPYGIASGW